ncbi:unnamed protein product [Urochloa humidicola]
MLPLPRPFHVMGRRPFLDVSTGEPIHVRLPDLYGRHHLLGSTAEGFLVLCRRDTLAVHLLNPLTGHRAASADLPRVTTLLNLKAESVPRTSEAPGSPATRRSRFTFYGGGYAIAVARPGDKCWMRLHHVSGEVKSAMSFAGRFYCVSSQNILVVETAASRWPPRLAWPWISGQAMALLTMAGCS